MLEKVVVAKPAFETFSVYVPGATLGNTYWPTELVVTVLVSFVAMVVRLTVASGTTAPPWSVTVPRTRAVLAVCAPAGAADRNAASKTNGMARLLKIFML